MSKPLTLGIDLKTKGMIRANEFVDLGELLQDPLPMHCGTVRRLPGPMAKYEHLFHANF
jgi:hypothetical protein